MVDTPQGGSREGDFAARLHHALMNPLTVVVGYAQLLAARKDLDEDVKNQVNRILEEARECVRLVERARADRHPAVPAAPGTTPEPRPQSDVRRKILVVDDETVILRLTAEVLGAEFEVSGIGDADEALRTLLIEDFDLVLLDVNLGGRISGRELFTTLQVQQPEVAERVVFMTGGVVGVEEDAFLNATQRECLRKPFHINVLRETVRRLAG